MVGPWIHYLEQLGVKGRKLSDIEFLTIKEFDAKLREDEAGLPVNTTGDLATLTANTGKDMYLARAKANVALDGFEPSVGVGQIVLKINNVIKAKWNFQLQISSGEGGTTMDSIEFPVGFMVTTGQVIKIEVITAGVDVLTEGQIVCFEENTGETPQIPSISN